MHEYVLHCSGVATSIYCIVFFSNGCNFLPHVGILFNAGRKWHPQCGSGNALTMGIGWGELENSSKTWLKKLWHIYNSLREHCLRIDVSMGAPPKKCKLTLPYRIPLVISKLSFCASLTTKKDYVWTDILKYSRSSLYQIITGCTFFSQLSRKL